MGYIAQNLWDITGKTIGYTGQKLLNILSKNYGRLDKNDGIILGKTKGYIEQKQWDFWIETMGYTGQNYTIYWQNYRI